MSIVTTAVPLMTVALYSWPSTLKPFIASFFSTPINASSKVISRLEFISLPFCGLFLISSFSKKSESLSFLNPRIVVTNSLNTPAPDFISYLIFNF